MTLLLCAFLKAFVRIGQDNKLVSFYKVYNLYVNTSCLLK